MLKNKKYLFVIGLIVCNLYAFAQSSIEVYPTNWFVGMKNQNLQLMVHHPNIASGATVSLSYPGVALIKTNKVENRNYLFLDVKIASTAKPGICRIVIKKNDSTFTVNYELKKRRTGNGTQFAQGVNASDFVYLLMPDRFSNGDTTNDRIAGMRDQSLNRDSIFLRHGGDLQGVINHLDYLQHLGVTTLWMTPVLENDMPNRTEHGYAFTNHYVIEPRFGGAEKYIALSDSLHRRGMKLIQDAVYNHVGLYHFTVQDPPMKDWLHQWTTFTQTNYREQTAFDPHGAKSQEKQLADGWFTTQMPDLNQSNPYVANYLIQHAIWSVETFGVDGWRIDTYIYNDLPFMNRCNQALLDEFPKITMFGETWVHGTANQAYFADNTINAPFKSNLPGVTDFQTLFYGIQPALMQPFGWTDGVMKLYQTLSNDFLYKDASRNCIFLDNHDLSRWFSVVNEDVAKDKMGFEWLLTSRGIPQMYYGDEVLMKGVTNPDGWVRLDFPGGWNGDTASAFTGKGVSDTALSVQQLIRTLANFRKTSPALTQGKLMQYIPVDGLYVYFRYTDTQTIMCIMNTSDTEKAVSFDNYPERTTGFSGGRNVLTRQEVLPAFKIPAKQMWVVELRK
ncbi:alpha-amylase [Ilyomonas limi]|uniref:Alpha-amylase n=1 Tax=Ilyomonas limi TaxID=2575867 RepID=A0A4U3L3T3_9BACT|nr:alpha-amylase family glycosyl hydrolase [Ilyomonas limi]TKK68964.1 alpha-amylase [Ilyomonas limi]